MNINSADNSLRGILSFGLKTDAPRPENGPSQGSSAASAQEEQESAVFRGSSLVQLDGEYNYSPPLKKDKEVTSSNENENKNSDYNSNVMSDGFFDKNYTESKYTAATKMSLATDENIRDAENASASSLLGDIAAASAGPHDREGGQMAKIKQAMRAKKLLKLKAWEKGYEAAGKVSQAQKANLDSATQDALANKDAKVNSAAQEGSTATAMVSTSQNDASSVVGAPTSGDAQANDGTQSLGTNASTGSEGYASAEVPGEETGAALATPSVNVRV